MKSFISSLLLIAVIAGVSFAGNRQQLRTAKPAKLVVDDGIERQTKPGAGSYVPGLDRPNALTWVAVDSMANVFGPASNSIQPIAYDPATNTIAVIHRGGSPYALGSGQLWYNVSRNNGVSWRRVSELNQGIPTTLRYPSCAIVNPAGSNDTSQCLFAWAAPNLNNAGGFGQISYGVDFPLGGGTGPSAFNDVGTSEYREHFTVWSQKNSPWVMWGTTNNTAATDNEVLWRTSDYSPITPSVPPAWRDTLPYFINAISYIVGKGTSTASYYAECGLFNPDSLAFAFNAGYSKSTNNGATWSGWKRPQPDWMVATGLDTVYDLYDYVQPPGGTVSYLQDMVIDSLERAHFFHVVVTSPWTTNDARGILEVYETATGWASKWVTKNLNTYTNLAYPDPVAGTTLDQTHNSIHASISPDGKVMTMVWSDAATMAQTDTFPDVWFSYRTLASAAWSTPVNLTQTPGFAELILHAAPVLKSNGGNSYTVFLGRCYQTDINTWPPNNTLKTTFFVAPYTFTAVTTSTDEVNGSPSSFALEQNYPNPFNPSTKISYTLPNTEHVRLTITNLLGQEVSTLVNERQTSGTHNVEFAGSNLPSGVYFYTLKTENFSSTKKMLLMK